MRPLSTGLLARHWLDHAGESRARLARFDERSAHHDTLLRPQIV